MVKGFQRVEENLADIMLDTPLADQTFAELVASAIQGGWLNQQPESPPPRTHRASSYQALASHRTLTLDLSPRIGYFCLLHSLKKMILSCWGFHSYQKPSITFYFVELASERPLEGKINRPERQGPRQIKFC